MQPKLGQMTLNHKFILKIPFQLKLRRILFQNDLSSSLVQNDQIIVKNESLLKFNQDSKDS